MVNLVYAAVVATAAALAAPAQAQIYKSTDENGNVVFSDTPPAGGASSSRIELPPTNTTPPPPVVVPVPRDEAVDDIPEPMAKSPEVSITSPANETTIPMGGGNFTVTAAVEGGRDGQQLQLLMDGVAQGEPQESGSWNLENVFRGAHDLAVQVLSAGGEVLATSEPVRVYVMRPSVN